MLKEKVSTSAFKSGDAASLRAARANLNKATRGAKRAHSQKTVVFKIPGTAEDYGMVYYLFQITEKNSHPCNNSLIYLDDLFKYFGQFK